ncbi:MAG: ABC transporter permease subunit [Methanobacteriota archaeon]
MRAEICRKTLVDLRPATLGWAVGLSAWVVLVVALWPSISANPAMDAYWASLPEAVRAFAGESEGFGTFEGFLHIEFLGTMPLVLSIFVVGAGTAAIAGEETARTMDLLLSEPVSRPPILLEKAAAIGAATIVILVASGAALAVAAFVVGAGPSPLVLLAATLYAAPFLLAVAAFSVAASAVFRKRRHAVFAATLFVTAAYLLESLGALVAALDPVRVASPFHHYAASRPLTDGFDVAGLAVLMALAAVFLGCGVFAFRRRDITV